MFNSWCVYLISNFEKFLKRKIEYTENFSLNSNKFVDFPHWIDGRWSRKLQILTESYSVVVRINGWKEHPTSLTKKKVEVCSISMYQREVVVSLSAIRVYCSKVFIVFSLRNKNWSIYKIGQIYYFSTCYNFLNNQLWSDLKRN